jgi:hypothetical protein
MVAAGAVPALLLASAPLTSHARSFRRRQVVHSLADYRECVGTWFSIHDESWKRVRLINVREHPFSDAVEQFSCLFRGRANSVLRSGTYVVRSRFLGQYQLYLTTTEDDGYESFLRADFALLR